jgi:hypothetical protein
MPTDHIEGHRNHFLNQLHSNEFNGASAGEFMSYWRAIEVQAKASEDMGQLDVWVKDLARDKDRVAEIRSKQQQAASSQMGSGDMLSLLNRILMLLDEIEGELKRRNHRVRNEIGMWVLLAGMGRTSKPKPKHPTKKQKQKEDDDITQHLLDKQKKKPDKPTKNPDR